MSNELLLFCSMIAEYSAVVFLYYLLDKEGLYLWTVLATITANIEVMILVHAFGIEMTLGNVLFATTFLVTDIMSELYGKEEAKKAVRIGIATSVVFVLISSTWLIYQPSAQDTSWISICRIFSQTPRLMFASIVVYVIVQYFDVWMYHRWWNWSNQKCGDRDRFLWLRNNGSTMISQLLNTVLYSIFAFAGEYSIDTLTSIMISSYAIFFVTSLVDTPFLYLCRRISKRKKLKNNTKDNTI